MSTTTNQIPTGPSTSVPGWTASGSQTFLWGPMFSENMFLLRLDSVAMNEIIVGVPFDVEMAIIIGGGLDGAVVEMHPLRHSTRRQT